MEPVSKNSDTEIQALPPSSIKNMKDIMAVTEFNIPKSGDVISGHILSTGKSQIFIDLGELGTGVVYPSEFYENPEAHKKLEVGAAISAILLDLENEDGLRELSLKQAQQSSAWQDVKEKRDTGEIITTKIININKGGLLIEINGIQGFLPLSQLSPEHYPKVEGGETSKIVQVLQTYRNHEFRVKILDFNEVENRLIVSEKAVLDNELKEKIKNLSVDDVVEGEITDVTDFGAFVKINDGIEGLIHISEIDWKIIDNPRDILSPGQKIKAKIKDIEGNKISLSIKALKPDPWIDIDKKYQVGKTVQGEVVKITNYGVLIKLEDDLMGLILNAEFGTKKPEEIVEIGKSYPMAIVNIDPKEHKMLLTIQEGLKNDNQASLLENEEKDQVPKEDKNEEEKS